MCDAEQQSPRDIRILEELSLTHWLPLTGLCHSTDVGRAHVFFLEPRVVATANINVSRHGGTLCSLHCWEAEEEGS